MSRQNYARIDSKELEDQLDRFIVSMNRCMIDINFRREPIYLSEDKLDQPKYVKYRFTIANSESLRLLRNHFIGRIMHTSVDQWKQNLTSLLDFNTKSTDDSTKWKKGVEIRVPGYKHPANTAANSYPQTIMFAPSAAKINPVGPTRCPKCRNPVETGQVRCSSCGLSLQINCSFCGSLRLLWGLLPKL